MCTYSDLKAFLHYYFLIVRQSTLTECRKKKKKKNSSPAREKTSAIGITLNAGKHKFDYVIGTSDWKTKQNKEIFSSARMTESKNALNK